MTATITWQGVGATNLQIESLIPHQTRKETKTKLQYGLLTFSLDSYNHLYSKVENVLIET